ncbi:hypothetical protein NXS19_005751 [Fusarium pseudograminearum]|nr:hypothetical protein NXS19_005751 [Fusarium pseudograminearum]
MSDLTVSLSKLYPVSATSTFYLRLRAYQLVDFYLNRNILPYFCDPCRNSTVVFDKDSGTMGALDYTIHASAVLSAREYALLSLVSTTRKSLMAITKTYLIYNIHSVLNNKLLGDGCSAMVSS